MRALKLNANFTECHGLAKALIMSPTTDRQFRAIIGNEFIVGDLNSEYRLNDWDFRSEILLPIYTLKLCPFVAMREKINVFADFGWHDGENLIKGFITAIFSKDKIEIDFFKHDFKSEDIMLDIKNLPKGAEVVELL